MFDPLIILFAFGLGFTLTRASTCTVAATRRLVVRRKKDWLVGIAVAVGWAGVTLIGLKAIFEDQVVGPSFAPINAMLIGAAVVMGVGAYLNNGCFIGSVGRISGGDTSYLMTFAGLVIARIIGNQFGSASPLVQAGTLSDSAFQLGTVWLFSALFLVLSAYGIVQALRKKKGAFVALCLMGVFAALTFASDPGWAYEPWIGRVVGGQGLSNDLLVEMAILALFGGAIISRILKGNFAFQKPSARKTVFCFLGGILMGLGAMGVPGGNDTLLLWTIPNFNWFGLVAYLVMVVTVALLLFTKQRVIRPQ